jgi:hypothetical protein
MKLHYLKCGSFLHPLEENGFHHQDCSACGWIYYNNLRPWVTASIYRPDRLLLV